MWPLGMLLLSYQVPVKGNTSHASVTMPIDLECRNEIGPTWDIMGEVA